MTRSWQTSYAELAEFIGANPSIRIEPRTKVIPADVRAEFYKLFDRVREDFILEYFSEGLSEAEELSRQFNIISSEVTSILGIQAEIGLNPKLRWLIDDPMNGMIRPLNNTLFELIKGELDQEAFVSQAMIDVADNLSQLFKLGYDIWLILAMVKWLEPTELWRVSQKEVNAINSLTELYKPGERVEPLPDARKAPDITFEPGTWDTFIAPDLIVYSGRLKKYVGLRRQLPVNSDEPYLTAKQLPAGRSWSSFKQVRRNFSLSNRWPSIMVYTGDDPQAIRLIADFKFIDRPDMVVDTLADEDSVNGSILEWAGSHVRHLEPSKGGVLVCRKEIAFPDRQVLQAAVNMEDDQQANPGQPDTQALRMINTGFDAYKAGEILGSLLPESPNPNVE